MLASSSISSIFRNADYEAVTNVILRKNAGLIYSNSVKNIREFLHNFIVNVLYSYRINCASTTSSG